MIDPVLISVDTVPAADGWGFVGRVLVGDQEAYHTIRTYPSPPDALSAAQSLLCNALGTLLASEEWRTAATHFGRAPRRDDLAFGLRPAIPNPREAEDGEPPLADAD